MRTIKKYYMKMHIIVFKGLKEPLNLTFASLRYKLKHVKRMLRTNKRYLTLNFHLRSLFLFRFLLEKWVWVNSHLFTQNHTLVRRRRSWLLNEITFHSSLTELAWAFSFLTQKITLIRCQIFWLLNFS